MGSGNIRNSRTHDTWYWADVLGLLVWAEMPSAYRFTKQSVRRVTHEWTDAIERDASHPCVVAWVPINESWGVPNLPDNPAERHYVRALYHLTHTLDPTRPVIGNDGWESVATDIIGIHDYDPDPERLAHRYHADEALPRLSAGNALAGACWCSRGNGIRTFQLFCRSAEESHSAPGPATGAMRGRRPRTS